MVESEAAQLKQESFYLQVLSIKEFDITDTKAESKKTVKLRCQLSDGESSVVAMMNKQVYDRMEDAISNFAIIEVFTFMKQNVKDRVILVLTKPPKLIYDCKVKIGEPKDYADNLKNGTFSSECLPRTTAIPKELYDAGG